MEIQLYKTHAYGREKNNGAHLYIIPEIKALRVEWFGYPTEEEYKAIILDGLEVLKEKKLEYWIADTRKLELISESANEWTFTIALPMGVQYGCKRLAFLLPQEYLAQFSVEEVAQSLEHQIKALKIDLQIKYFDSLEKALQWTI
ncbi:MAG: STAS/SEC14 domain-containing protein [Bacteroidia bacterium]|nr:STAS/SEC14 domain-containing protein [Bacteroidia bacterium]MDW8158059.1 STAS/SEC14 domain-containing protein [Bacteroidia bacterium]